MAYENKTVDYVYELLINSFQEKFNSRFRLLPKSFIVVLSKVLAGVFVILYKQVGWFYLQLFPDTASFETVDILGHTINPLVQLGKLFGVGEPTSGQTWEGRIAVSVVSEGRASTAGTQLKSERTGLVYLVNQTVTTENESVTVPVYCSQPGTAGNLEAGDTLKFVSPLGFVATSAIVTESTLTGTDDESEEHYRSWAFDAEGVLQTYPYNGENSPGDVEIYVAGITDIYPDRVPDRALCVAVGEACTFDPETGIANRRPLTAILDPENDGTYLNIKPVSIVSVDVYVTDVTGIDPSDFGASFKSSLNTYLLGREPYIRGLSDDNNRTNVIQTNSLISIANTVATSLKGQFGTVTMQIEEITLANYMLGKGELSALGKLFVNGVEYED